MNKIKTINSLSGGKTSSYMAVHYPADIDMFALVCIDCHNANGNYWRKNPKLLQMVRDKLEKTSTHWPEFLAAAEDPVTIRTMFDLEQKIGREITWIRGVGFDQLIYWKKAIPNIKMRFCTEYMKIIPMFEYIYMYLEPTITMNIGFRYDEMHRANVDETISFPYYQKIGGNQKWIHNYHYRKLEYPMIDDKIMRPHVVNYWNNNQDVVFPEDTGCQNCYWKDPQQIKLNLERSKATSSIIKWANVFEHIMGNRFKKDISMQSIFEIGVQMDFFGGTGPGCQAGICGI